jgi:hypothetical protein
MSKASSVIDLVYIITEIYNGYKNVDWFLEYLRKILKLRKFAQNEMERRQRNANGKRLEAGVYVDLKVLF